MKFIIKFFKITLIILIFVFTIGSIIEFKKKKLFNELAQDKHYIFSEDDIKKFGPKARFLNAYRLKNSDPKRSRIEFEVVAAEDEKIKPQALYNIGNLLIEEALNDKSQELFEAGIKYYKSSLRENPELKKAKYNLELAKKLLKANNPSFSIPKSKNLKDPGFLPKNDKDI